MSALGSKWPVGRVECGCFGRCAGLVLVLARQVEVEAAAEPERLGRPRTCSASAGRNWGGGEQPLAS